MKWADTQERDPMRLTAAGDASGEPQPQQSSCPFCKLPVRDPLPSNTEVARAEWCKRREEESRAVDGAFRSAMATLIEQSGQLSNLEKMLPELHVTVRTPEREWTFTVGNVAAQTANATGAVDAIQDETIPQRVRLALAHSLVRVIRHRPTKHPVEVKQLTSMGFTEEEARQALDSTSGSVEQAIALLLE